MKTKAITLILTLIILNTHFIYAQFQVKGKVLDEKEQSIDYFQAAILNLVDSTYLKGGAFIDGSFELNQNNSNNVFLKVSALGFKDKFISVDVNSQPVIDLGNIIMDNESISLSEVVVRANSPRVKMEQDKLVLNIENTLISDAGTALDVLKRTPFVIVDGNDVISVAGRGNTLILLNGRRIRSNQEVSSLSSTQIKQVEVIENPSSKYDAEGHAIINIVTLKTTKHSVNASLYSLFRYGRFSNLTKSVEFSYNVSKLNIYLRYTYNKSKTEGLNYNWMQYDKPDYTFKSYQYDVDNTMRSHRNGYNFGLDYSLNQKHKIGFQADGYITNRSSDYTRYLEIERNWVKNPTQKSHKQAGANPRNNAFSVNYSFKDLLGYEINFVADYIAYRNSNTENINETNEIQSYTNLLKNNSKVNYDLYSAKIDGIIPFRKINSRLELGGKYSTINNRSDVIFSRYQDSQWVEDGRYSNNVFYSEELLAFYLLYAGNINKWNYSAGLRAESDMVRNKDQTQNILRDEQLSLFPNITAGYRINDAYSINLTYSRRISRPSYSTLNNTLYYLDSLSTRQGNPYLKSTFFNTASLKTVLNKNIIATISYSYIEDPVDLMFINDRVNIEQFTVISKNTKNTWQIGFNLSGSFNYKKWSTQPFFSYTYRPATIVDDDLEYTFQNPSYYIAWNNQLALPRSWTIEFNPSFFQPGGSYMDFGKQVNLDIGVRKKMLKNKLTIQLSYYDELYKWTQHYQYSYKTYKMTYDGDRRYISLSLRYNFNTSPLSLKRKSASEDERNRM